MNSNEKESNEDDDENGDNPIEEGKSIEDSQESNRSIILEQKSDDLGLDFGCALSKTPQEDDKTPPVQQPKAEMKEEATAMACADKIQNGDLEKDNHHLVMEREEGSVVEWDPVGLVFGFFRYPFVVAVHKRCC